MKVHVFVLVFIVVIEGFSANTKECTDKKIEEIPTIPKLSVRIDTRGECIRCLETRIEELVRELGTIDKSIIDDSDKTAKLIQLTIKRNSLDALKTKQRNDRNLRNFRGGSFIFGKAVLENSPNDGASSELIDLMGVQALFRSVNDDTAGFGFFGAVDLQGVHNGTVNYAGFGLAFSSRLPDSGHPFTIGFGYGIDRVSKSNSEDRTGLFILFSFNPPATVTALTPKFKEIFK